ncbi:putative prophage membrane protein [Citrobacter rodentium ICC168]|uniref:Prophage membrane protein n=1 Tax=Citrobacter rodentium (strain ICC168) TaxID=637910 RepID=D2TUV0_CITRI|nr:putative prophage membrane protein [Citrobacter rodentium ICC168]
MITVVPILLCVVLAVPVPSLEVPGTALFTQETRASPGDGLITQSTRALRKWSSHP